MACLDSNISIRVEVSEKASKNCKYGHRSFISDALHDDRAGYVGSGLQGPAITNSGYGVYGNETEDRKCVMEIVLTNSHVLVRTTPAEIQKRRSVRLGALLPVHESQSSA